MRQPEKFVSISYPHVDFLIPSDYVISAVGVKNLDTEALRSESVMIFDFDEIAAEFTQESHESEIKTMVNFRDDDNNRMCFITAQECRVCTIQLKDFSLFSDFYSEPFKKLGLLACSFKDGRIRFLIDVNQMIKHKNDSSLEEL